MKIDPKAPLKDPARYVTVGKPLPRPDVRAKVTGHHVFVHDFAVDGMLHGRPIRPPSVAAKLLEVDAASIKDIPGARVVRIESLLGVVAEDEWDAVQAARLLKARWSEPNALIGHERVREWMRAGPFDAEEYLVRKGEARQQLAAAAKRLTAEYYWPLQTHGSMGPSCAVADVREGKATIWTASQATHKFREAFAAFLGLPQASVRLIYLDGAGCYGMNGHDAAAAVELARAGQDRQLLCRRRLHRRARRRGAARSDRVPPASPVRSARYRSHPPRSGSVSLAAASLPGGGAESARERPRLRLRALQAQRDLRRDGARSRGRSLIRRDPRAARGLRPRLRTRHQSRRAARADRGLHSADAVARAVRGSHF